MYLPEEMNFSFVQNRSDCVEIAKKLKMIVEQLINLGNVTAIVLVNALCTVL